MLQRALVGVRHAFYRFFVVFQVTNDHELVTQAAQAVSALSHSLSDSPALIFVLQGRSKAVRVLINCMLACLACFCAPARLAKAVL